MKIGDIVFNIHNKQFAEITHVYNESVFAADYDLNVGHLWPNYTIVVVNPDTPQNRLKIQLKYA
jgi:hypothetical protein